MVKRAAKLDWVYFIYLEIHSWALHTIQYSQKQNWNGNNHNRKVSRQCTDRYLQCKQGTVLNVTGSYKYTLLIQQLVRVFRNKS